MKTDTELRLSFMQLQLPVFLKNKNRPKTHIGEKTVSSKDSSFQK